MASAAEKTSEQAAEDLKQLKEKESAVYSLTMAMLPFSGVNSQPAEELTKDFLADLTQKQEELQSILERLQLQTPNNPEAALLAPARQLEEAISQLRTSLKPVLNNLQIRKPLERIATIESDFHASIGETMKVEVEKDIKNTHETFLENFENFRKKMQGIFRCS